MSVIPSSGITSEISKSLEFNKENEILGNRPPYVPSNPIPEDGEADVPIDNIVIDWTGGDPDQDDEVKYDVYFGKSSPPPLVVYNKIPSRYDPGIMDTYTTYYWQIVARDNHGATTTGPMWNFTTGSRTNRPPNAPEITAEKIFSNMFLIKFNLTDPDGDDLRSLGVCWEKIDFCWIYDGPWANGTVVEMQKGYSDGTHQIRAKCVDLFSEISEWGYLELKVGNRKLQSSQQSTTGSSSQNVMNIVPSSRTIINNGTLSGYVNDTSRDPIDGALVRVHFHGTYEEDYSDENGYYHVTNIPICYCMKNCTCSKEEYKTEWVLLGIVEDTTYDFVLTSTNNPPDAPTIDGPISGKPGIKYDYVFSTEDPEGDNVSYYVEWGDGESTGWTDYYESGEEVAISHTWEKIDWDNIIRAKAKDVHGAEGNWSVKEVPINKAIVNQISQQSTNLLFVQILQRLMNTL